VPLLIQELIRIKRDGGALSDDEIRAFISGITDGTVPDYQAAAMLMAVFLRGLDDRETASWAHAMVHSGDVVDLSAIDRPKVDKHSTGGVGDKISLPLAAAAAACGLAVPMVSGRGLGHTGGTLDKLESIPGFQVHLDLDRFVAQVRDLGVCLIGQTERMAPADRVLYALRDVTATVESVPLIASSIMSKKLAEGIDALVLDCKTGSGAFMKTRDEARRLARTIQAIGRAADTPVTVVLTRMSEPIGRAVGNATEVIESIEVLRGAGPADTRALTVALGAEMLLCGGLCATVEDGSVAMERVLDNGSALELFARVVEAQGGDRRAVDDPSRHLPAARGRTPVLAPTDGYVSACAADQIGIAALLLGAGRRRKEDAIDPAVGIEIACRIGDRVEAGQPLAFLLHCDRGVEAAHERVARAYTLAPAAPAPDQLILEVLR
jgi:pyrimidine-nucleoside phosphorylase